MKIIRGSLYGVKQAGKIYDEEGEAPTLNVAGGGGIHH